MYTLMVERSAESLKNVINAQKLVLNSRAETTAQKINTISSNGSWDWSKTGNKLQAKHVTYEKLANIL